ncbi:MAG: hypothetical protein IJ711_03895 [Lachnospiraceae bacterium]|nr:hypothetical protein [Lachnospiraceae bacterium]
MSLDEYIETLIATTAVILLFVYHIHCNLKSRKKVDGVENIDGIRYRIANEDVSYVMYKLGAFCISKVIKKTSFEKLSENEGILTFGGVEYTVGNVRGGTDFDIGAKYRIKCLQDQNDVLMDVSFEELQTKWCYHAKKPHYELNQAYHRFFKEQLGVVVERYNNRNLHER